MAIEVVETESGYEISWDPSDSIERVLSDWTEEDFLEIIMTAAEKVLEEATFEGEFMAK